MRCDREICLPHDYSKTKDPKNACSDDPVEVAVKFTGIQVMEVNDIKLTVTIHMVPSISWIDQRIVLLNISSRSPIDLTWMDHLWFPDTSVINLKRLTKYKLLGKNAASAGV